jgi:hypothetical protein
MRQVAAEPFNEYPLKFDAVRGATGHPLKPFNKYICHHQKPVLQGLHHGSFIDYLSPEMESQKHHRNPRAADSSRRHFALRS